MKHPIDRWTTPEAALVSYRSSGDPDAVRALFDHTAPTLFRVALASAPDAPSAEDLLQETYIAFLGRLDAFELGQPVMPWLLGILRNRIKRARRSATRRPDPRRLALRENPELRHARDEASVVRAAIEALDEPYRSVGLLHFVYGLEPAEIAHVRGQSPGTVRSQLHRARERLSSRLRTSPALLLLGDPVRSLSAVREAVVADAASAAVAAAGAALVGGMLMTKKVIALAALAALLIGGVVVARLAGDEARVDEATNGPLLVSEAVEAPVLKGTAPVPAVHRVATPPDGPHVAGRVVDAEGSPIAGARLAVIPSNSKVGRDPYDESIGSAFSDSGGRFFVPLGDDAPSFFLYAEARGYAPRMAHEVRDGDEVIVTLDRATALTGVVRNRDREAVPGAQVKLLAMIGGASRTWQTRADAAGTYRIEGLPTAAPTTPTGTSLGCWIRAVAGGYAVSTTMHQLTAAAGETQTKDVYVLRGVLIRGQVVLAGSKIPVADAHVVLVAPSGRSRAHMLVFGYRVGVPFASAPLARTRADAKGRFTFEHAPSAPLGRAPGGDPVVYAWGSNTCFGLASLTGAEDEGDMEITVEVHPAAIVTGRLVDAAGAAVGDAPVWVSTTGLRAARGRSIDEAPHRSGRTGGAGRFRLAGVPARVGEKMPAVFASGGRVHFGAPYQMVVERDIEVEGGATLDLGTLVCEESMLPEDRETHTSRIRIVDATGKAVWGAAVGHSFTNLLLRTDREGRTAITWGGSGGGPVLMLVRASGFATQLVDVPMGGPEQIVEITRETATLRGTVVGPSDEPIGGASVEVAPESVPAADAFPADENFWQVSRFVVGVGTTDREGRFTVGDLEPGIYRLRARRAAGGTTGSAKHMVVVSGLETSDEEIEVRLPSAPASDGVRVEVRIVDAQSGRAVLGATASLRSGARTLVGMGDGPGRRFFTGVTLGEAPLSVSAPGYISVLRSITVGVASPSPIEVLLVSGAGLKGRVDLPVPKAEYLMYRMWLFATTGELLTDPAYRVSIAPDGTFETRGLKAGRYYVVAWRLSPKAGTASNLVPRDAFVDIPKSGTVQRTFVFEAGGTLKVYPSDNRLPPKPRSIRAATPEQARFGKQSWLLLKDEAGNDVMRHEGLASGYAGTLGRLTLRPGRYTLHVQFDGDDRREIPVTIEAGTEKTLLP